MFTTVIISEDNDGKLGNVGVAINENQILSIKDRSNIRDTYCWRSMIELSDGTVYLCKESMSDLLDKIEHLEVRR